MVRAEKGIGVTGNAARNATGNGKKKGLPAFP